MIGSFRSKHDNYVLARTEICDILEEYWNGLCDKYQIYPELFIIDHNKRFDTLMSDFMKYVKTDDIITIESTIEFLKKSAEGIISYNDNIDAIMFTVLNPYKKPLSSVFITYEDIECILTLNKPIDVCIEYLKQSLLHEMGHCISNEDIYNLNMLDTHIIRNDKIIQSEYIRYIDMNISQKSYLWDLAYFNSPMELRANNAVGLTADECVLQDMIMCNDI